MALRVVTGIARVVIPRLLATFQSLATKYQSFQYGAPMSMSWSVLRSDNVIKKASQFKKSELGRRDGITSEILLSKSFLKMHLKVPNNGVRRSVF